MLGLLLKKFRKRKKDDHIDESPFNKLKRYSDFKTLKYSAPFVKLFAIILKNYKLLIRSRISVMVFLFGPLLVIFLVSLGFNTSSLVGLNLGVYSESYSSYTDSLISNLTINHEFNLIRYTAQDKCVDSVKFGESTACLIFPKDMAIDNVGDVITIYVDNSRINLANSIVEKLNSNINLQSKDISAGLVSQLLGALVDIKSQAETGRSYVSNLRVKNRNNEMLISSLNSAFDNIDLEYSNDNLADILSDLDTLKDRWNLSTGDIASVRSGVYKMHSTYTELTSKADTAKQYLDSLKGESKTIKSSVSKNVDDINNIESRLKTITDDVDKVKIVNVEGIVMPLKTKIEPLSLKKTYFFYTIPLLLTILIMFVSIFMSSTSIVRERRSPAYFRNFITPTFDGLFVIAHYLTYISIIILQLAAVLGFSALILQGLAYLKLVYIGLVLLLVASLFIFLGLVLGFSLNHGESVTLSAISISTLLLVFSNAILPLEALTIAMRKIVAYNPIVISENILKRIILFDSSYAAVSRPLIYLGVWVIILAVLSFITAELTKRMKYS